jgi:hypothetical protein
MVPLTLRCGGCSNDSDQHRSLPDGVRRLRLGERVGERSPTADVADLQHRHALWARLAANDVSQPPRCRGAAAFRCWSAKARRRCPAQPDPARAGPGQSSYWVVSDPHPQDMDTGRLAFAVGLPPALGVQLGLFETLPAASIRNVARCVPAFAGRRLGAARGSRWPPHVHRRSPPIVVWRQWSTRPELLRGNPGTASAMSSGEWCAGKGTESQHHDGSWQRGQPPGRLGAGEVQRIRNRVRHVRLTHLTWRCPVDRRGRLHDPAQRTGFDCSEQNRLHRRE